MMFRVSAASLAVAALSGSVLATSDPLNCAENTDVDVCKGVKGCKWAKTFGVCYNKSLGEPSEQTLAPETPAPTEEPTPTPTEAPTASPTGAPTDAPTQPTGPFTQVECSVLTSKGPCNRTPTCFYKNQEDVCAGCSDQEGRGACDNVAGCMWRRGACQADDRVPHPEDDACAAHTTKRHCKSVGECQWMRNGKCQGHRGCGTLRNNVDCRSAFNCFWMPRDNTCVEVESVQD